MTLSELKNGCTGRITGIEAQGESTQRLFRLGVIPGASARVLRRAPLGDPLQVQVDGTLLSIRRRDAQAIHIAIEEVGA